MKRHRLNCLVLSNCNVWLVMFPVSYCNATLCCCGILGKLVAIVVSTTTTTVTAITVEKSVGELHSYCYLSCFLRILTKPS